MILLEHRNFTYHTQIKKLPFCNYEKILKIIFTAYTETVYTKLFETKCLEPFVSVYTGFSRSHFKILLFLTFIVWPLAL